jgi:tetratricopeptide (TPR) repeat protein
MKSKDKTQTVRGVWSPKALVIFSLLFSVFPSLIMFALNYSRYGFPRKRNLWLFITGSLLVIMLILSFVSPEWSWHRSFILTVAITWIFYFKQIGLYRQWITSGKEKATIRSGLLICCLCFGALIATSTAAVMLTEDDYVAYELILNEQYTEAEKVLMESRQLFPDDLDVKYNLAVVYSNTERPDMAKHELQNILKIDPENEDTKAFLLEFKTQ